MGWVYGLKDSNAQTDAPRLIAICLSFSTCACLATAVRFYARLFTKRTPGLDDYATLSSAILSAAYSGVAIAQTRWGQALDPKAFPPENLIPFSKVQYAGGPIYTLALLGFKLSLLASYLRIGGHNRAYCYVIYAVMAACTVNQLIFTCVISFACNPIAKQWDASIPGYCIETVKSYYAIAGTSLGFDVIIIMLPLPILWTLKLNLKQKIVLVGVFALGFFVTVIQIIRIFTIANLKTYTNSEPIVIWSSIEINLGVIITCIPTYAPLFHAFSDKISSNRYPSGTAPTSGSQYAQSRNGTRTQRSERYGSHSARHHGHSVDSRATNTHEMHSRTPKLWKALAGGDTESEEHIIRPDDSHGKIYAVTEVTVESHKRSAED